MIEITAIIVLISMLLLILRAILGTTIYDKILAANSFGTKTVLLIVLLAISTNNDMLLDIALVYVLVNFVTTIGFLKYFKYQSFSKE